jgi:glucose/mannose-6-phosphate isomerase
MKNHIENFQQDLVDALKISENNHLSKSYPIFSNILICGLGGSGIGGMLVSKWLENELSIPVNSCQDYTIPKYVNANTLVIACSYSGDTEETLSAVALAHGKGASIIGLTSGGKLEAFCAENGYEFLVVPGGKPPRTQLAFMCVLLVSVCTKLGMISPTIVLDFYKAREVLLESKEKIQQEAREIAKLVHGKNLIIYAEAKDEAIAIRARQQFNENSKILCSHHVIPEMNHNELVGWAGGTENHAVLFLQTPNMHPQNSKRMAFSKRVVEAKTPHVAVVETNIETPIVASFYLIHILDWASYYLATRAEVDPVEVDIIVNLKGSLV